MLEVSLIVYFKNRISHLETYFAPLVIQKNINYEVIAIDYCSTDTSLEYVKQFKNNNKHLRIIKVHGNLGFNLSKARNIGCYEAKSNICMTVDADILFKTKDTLRHWFNIFQKWNQFTSDFYNSLDEVNYYDRGILCYCGSGNMFMYKSLWQRSGGFPHFIKNHGMEDTIFRLRAAKIGGKCYEYMHQNIYRYFSTYGPSERNLETREAITGKDGYIPCESIWEDPTQNTKNVYNRMLMDDPNRLYELNDSLPSYIEL